MVSRKRNYGTRGTRRTKRQRKGTQVSSFVYPTKGASFSSPSFVSPLATRLFTTFTYAEPGIALDPGVAGTAGVRVFALNGLYDTDITGLGHQPAGYDEMMSIYEHYTVYAVKYKISWYGVDESLEYIGGVSVNDSVTAQTDPRVYIENGQTQWSLSTNKGVGSGERICTYSGYVDLAKVHGHTKSAYLDENTYQGTATTNPTDSAYLHIWVAPANAVSDAAVTIWCVELQFYAMLSGGKFKALS